VPGWFTPGEAEKAARLKGMTLPEFFRKYLTVDYWMGETVFALRPRTTREPGGKESAFNPLGQCVFFQHGRCSIHAAKPHECATAVHSVKIPKDWHERTANRWRTKRATAQIAKLLGREPQEGRSSISDLIAFLPYM